MSARKGIASFVLVVQTILLLSHYILYQTWTFSWAGSDAARLWFGIVLGGLSVSFVIASLLAFRYTNVVVRVFYRIAAVWLGFFSFLFLASIIAWLTSSLAGLAGVPLHFHRMVEVLFAAGLLAGAYGVINAGWTR